MSKKRIILSIASFSGLLLGIVGITLINVSGSAKADSASLSGIVEKAQINSLPSCYKNGLVKHLETNTLGANGEDIIDNSNIVSMLPGYTRGGYRKLLADCRQILFGGNLPDSSLGRFNGLYDVQNTKYKPEDFGYQPAQNSEKYDKKCLQATFSLRDKLPGTNQTLDNLLSNIICVPTDSNDNVISDGLSSQVDVFPATGDHAAIQFDVRTYIGYLDSTDVVGGIPGIYVGSLSSGNSVYIDHPVCYSAEGISIEHSCNMSWSTFQNRVKAAFEEGGAINIKVDEVKVNNLGDSSAASSYELDNTNDKSATAALKYIKGNSAKFADYVFTPTDWAVLYKTYYDEISKKYPDKVTVSATECSENKNQHVYAVTQDGGTTWCKLDIAGVDGVTETFAVRDSDTKLKPGKFGDVITGLMNLDYSKVDKDAIINGTTNGDGASDGDNSAPSCFTDAGSLGWILCPVIQATGSATAAMYEHILSNWLTVDASLLHTSGDDTGVYQGWSQFRTFANILFIIGFVVVILAQVTGIGISNYNIKKILPKLIVVAILVNISFIICQIVVDLSNLVGVGLYNILIDLNTGASDNVGIGNIAMGFLSTLNTAIIGGVGLTAAVVATISNPGAVLIPIALALISALLGVVFFFIILAVRKACVIVLIVLAPIAVVCYALPNTKPFFDRWKKVFTALLLVYPICSIVMGGGRFVSGLILKNTDADFITALVAMLLQVIPIFFIPTVLRSSLAAVGNIGAKISSLGARISGTATGAMRNSNAAKRLGASMDYWGATKGQKAVGAISRGVGHIPGVGRLQRSKFGRAISAGHNRSVARSMVNYEKMRLDEGNNQFIAENMTPDSIQQALDAQQFDQEQKLINNAAQSISAGSASYTDTSGNAQKINVNDLESSSANSLNSAFQSLRSQYDASGGTDRQIGNQMNAIAKTMISRYGDKGRSLVMKSLKGNADQTGAFSRTASFDSLSSYISRDEKWMSALKKEDPGAFNMVSDGANATKVMQNLQAYNSAGASKVTASSVPNLSDDFFDGYKKAISTAQKSGVFSSNNAADVQQVEDFDRMVQSFEQAAADPIISRSIQPDDLKKINGINKELYNAKRDDWKANNPGKTDADYAAQFGNYRDIAIGQSVKISHKQMPAGWHRATTAEVIAHGGASAGFSEGDWVNGSGAGAVPTRLSAADQKRAEAIEDYNIKADLNNNP